jgi:hypothetical protein
LRPWEISIHPNIPWLGATLDRIVVATPAAPDPLGGCCSGGPLQIKMALGSASEWKDEPPLGYVIQVQIEMACCGADWGALCALVGPGPLKVHDLKFAPAFFESALPKLDAFRQCVERREPPAADALPETSNAIRKLWSQDNGGTVALDHAGLNLVRAWERAGQAVANAEKEQKLFENLLRARMGGAAFGMLPDGSYVSLLTTERDGYTVEPTRYRTLRRFWPRLLTR